MALYRQTTKLSEIRRMTFELLDLAVREVSYVAVLVLGALCLVAAALTMAGWVFSKLLRVVGLRRDFLEFLRTRRKM